MRLLSADFDGPWVLVSGVWTGKAVVWNPALRTRRPPSLPPAGKLAAQANRALLPGRGPAYQVTKALGERSSPHALMQAPAMAQRHQSSVAAMPARQQDTSAPPPRSIAEFKSIQESPHAMAQSSRVKSALGLGRTPPRLALERDGREIFGMLIERSACGLEGGTRSPAIGPPTDETPVQAWGFAQVIPYDATAQRLALSQDGVRLGVIDVVPRAPSFELIAPIRPGSVDPEKTITLRWKKTSPDPAFYRLRILIDGVGHGLTGTAVQDGYDVDLVDLPGGTCAIQVLATNGYHTSYVETPSFVLQRRAPTINVFFREGPDLWVEARSDAYDFVDRSAFTWWCNGKAFHHGSTFDVRKLGKGVHLVRVSAIFPDGATVGDDVGLYDGKTGRAVPNIQQALAPRAQNEPRQAKSPFIEPIAPGILPLRQDFSP